MSIKILGGLLKDRIPATPGGASGSFVARKGLLAWVHADRLRFVVSHPFREKRGKDRAAKLLG